MLPVPDTPLDTGVLLSARRDIPPPLLLQILCVVHTTSSKMPGAPAISLAGSEHKGLFLISAGYWKTGNVLSSALLSSRAGLCCFSCSPAGFWSRLCLTCMGETGSTSRGDSWNRKNSVESAGVGSSQRLQTTQISPCKSQAAIPLVFFKVPQFEDLTAVKRQKKKTFCGLLTFSCWWLLLSTFAQVCTHGLVFSL